jgi:heptaprenyl diphosphate synthase
MVKTSVSGGIAHNLAQAAVAAILTVTPQVSYYVPFLVISGAVSGFFTGILCSLLMLRLKPARNTRP